MQIARRLRATIRTQVGLPITVGIARTKFLAKVASAVAKPDGLLEVAPERELAFLHALPVECLWGVGRVTSAKLRARGIRTVAQVAEFPEETLRAWLGRAAGRHLSALDHNRDPRPVRTRSRRRSIGAQRALGRRQRSPEEIAAAVLTLVERVARRMRSARRNCRTVVLRLRYADYSRATRSFTMPRPTDRTQTILAVAAGLLRLCTPTIERRGLTLIGVALTNLGDRGGEQLTLPFDHAPALDAALDSIRDRFGSKAITRAVLLGREPEAWVPLLRD